MQIYQIKVTIYKPSFSLSSCVSLEFSITIRCISFSDIVTLFCIKCQCYSIILHKSIGIKHFQAERYLDLGQGIIPCVVIFRISHINSAIHSLVIRSLSHACADGIFCNQLPINDCPNYNVYVSILLSYV